MSTKINAKKGPHARCLAVRPYVAGAFLRLNHLFSSRLRLAFVSIRERPRGFATSDNEGIVPLEQSAHDCRTLAPESENCTFEV